MIAQRLAELQKSANRWRENRLSETPFIVSTNLAERKNALLRRNSSAFENEYVAPANTSTNSLTTKSFIISKSMANDETSNEVGKPEVETTPCRRGILEERKNSLAKSSERWRCRVRTDSELENLEAVGRLRKDHKCTVTPTRTYAIDIGKGLDRFYSSPSGISPPSKLLHVSDVHFDDIAPTTPKLLVPSRPLARRRIRSRATHRLPEFSSPTVNSAPVTPVDYRLKREQSEEGLSEARIATSAKRGLQSKLDYSAVKLKRAEVKSPYPDLMLIRVKGEKHADVRLVAPKFSSVHAYGVFILLTPSRIFLYTGKYANLVERTKATQIVTSVCSKNGELGCHAKRVEEVNGRGNDDFWKMLGCADGHSVPDDYVPDELLESAEPFENLIATTNIVFKIAADHSVFFLSSAEVPKYSIFHPNANLVFDFGSEIYVWAGRSADRNGTRQALAYAEELRCQSAPHIKNSQLLFGDSFDGGRPQWCVLIKLAQGLGDTLFRHKFHDWKSSTVRLSSRWEMRAPKQIIKNTLEEEALAVELGRLLAENPPKESLLIFEETELARRAHNVFTERLEFMVLEGENELRQLDDMHVFTNDACYVIKWEYRIERSGIHKLDGSKREHDTGRRRTAFFFWLGSKTTKKQQGLCALALRDLDRERHPHERVLQDQEPPLLLQFFSGTMIVTGTGSNVFIVLGSSLANEYRMVELHEPIVFRSHGVYVIVRDDTITVWYGAQSKEIWRNAALHLAKHVLKVKHAYFKNLKEHAQIVEVNEEVGGSSVPVISADNWEQAPRLIRLYETDGKDVPCAQWDPQMPFSFHQQDLRDTMLVDQGTRLWLWTTDVASTYALRVANAYWQGRNGAKCVICKTREPDAFKALFPEWENFIDEAAEEDAVQESPERSDPCELDELLRSRTKHWPLEKVVARELPSGVDLKRLEQYLNDEDFESVFQMDRKTFYGLPLWKQIELRKKHRLF